MGEQPIVRSVPGELFNGAWGLTKWTGRLGVNLIGAAMPFGSNEREWPEIPQTVQRPYSRSAYALGRLARMYSDDPTVVQMRPSKVRELSPEERKDKINNDAEELGIRQQTFDRFDRQNHLRKIIAKIHD